MKELVYVLPAIIVIIVVAIFAYKAKTAKREEPLKTEGTEEKKEALFCITDVYGRTPRGVLEVGGMAKYGPIKEYEKFNLVDKAGNVIERKVLVYSINIGTRERLYVDEVEPDRFVYICLKIDTDCVEKGMFLKK